MNGRQIETQKQARTPATALALSDRGFAQRLLGLAALLPLAAGCGHGAGTQPTPSASASPAPPAEEAQAEPLALELPSARPEIAAGAEVLPDGRRCVGDGRVHTRQIAPGVVRHTCREALSAFEHHALQHGPELDVVTIG